jgi:transcriptional regulator with XRE-family HTH domain
MQDIGHILRELRESRQISQNSLGELLGMTQSAIYRIESGNSSPTIETITKIADYFHVSVDYLLGRVPSGDTISQHGSDINNSTVLVGKSISNGFDAECREN